jgi:hypothetical protein
MRPQDQDRWDETRVSVILKTSEPEGVYVPYWQGEDDFEQARR